MQTKVIKHAMFGIVVLSLISVDIFSPSFSETLFYPWKIENYAIKKPLGNFNGDAQRGRKIVINKDKGNCLACHNLPIPEESFHGTVGPPLQGIASRLSKGQIRLRVADEQKVIPTTIMPGFYKDPKENNRVDDDFWGKPVLTAQEAEDVIAYLMTLK